jgi:hypothetical protein
VAIVDVWEEHIGNPKPPMRRRIGVGVILVDLEAERAGGVDRKTEGQGARGGRSGIGGGLEQLGRDKAGGDRAVGEGEGGDGEGRDGMRSSRAGPLAEGSLVAASELFLFPGGDGGGEEERDEEEERGEGWERRRHGGGRLRVPANH